MNDLFNFFQMPANYHFRTALTCCFTVLMTLVSAQPVTRPADTEQYIHKGQFNTATDTIHSRLQKTDSDIIRADLYFQLGEIERLQGDMEGALKFWKMANRIRREVYPPGDYHLAWNYALLSHYHYEKIHPKQAKSFADSCAALLLHLTPSEQLEIKVYKIWNILAQSFKMHPSIKGYQFEPWYPVYSDVWDLYERSIAFQIAHETPRHDLAKTYHLLGNAYHDMVRRAHGTPGKEALGDQFFEEAHRNYDLALKIWEDLYGPQHYEKGLTCFVKAMLYDIVSAKRFPQSRDMAEQYYERALTAFGVSSKSDYKSQLTAVPNKTDLLMCLKLFTEMYLKDIEHNHGNATFEKIDRLNQMAIELWEIVQGEITSPNLNQYLATYYLIPYKLTHWIEMEKKNHGLDFSLETLFSANQRLKYYDLFRPRNGPASFEAKTIADIQVQLRDGECFLDFHTNAPFLNTALVIHADTAFVHTIDPDYLLHRKTFELIETVVDFNYPAYKQLAQTLFHKLLDPIDINDITKLIICPHGQLNNLPFEALICSKSNFVGEDYRQLDYLINHCEVEYTLSPQSFRNTATRHPFSFSVFAPELPADSHFSDLPFSKKFAEDVANNGFGQAYTSSTIEPDLIFSSASSILHLNTHGVIDVKGSEFADLVMGATRINLASVYDHTCRAQLVVLNACNSSRGIVYFDDGIHGFSRAFFSSGAKSVLSNGWEVDDQSSNAVLSAFYDDLRKGLSTTSALRNAKLGRIQRANNSNQAAPYYWAGHQLVGREIVFSYFDKEARLWSPAVSIVGLIIVIAGGVWAFRALQKAN